MKVFAKLPNILLFSVTSIISTSSCSNTTKIPSESETNNGENDFIDSDMFFPKLYDSDYYQYVDFDNDAYPKITDEFLLKVIEDVVKRVATSNGTINFTVERYNNNQVDINFKWIYNNQILYKTYSFEIRK